MKKSKSELDVDLMKRLYEFGGLKSYHVEYFDPVSFKVVITDSTFNMDVALEELYQKRKSGLVAEMFSEIIHFRGAFKKPKKRGS